MTTKNILLGTAAALLLMSCASGGGGIGGSSDDGKRKDGNTVLTCLGIIQETYECFDGRFVAEVAGGEDKVQPQAVQPFLDRKPKTVAFALNASGINISAPLPAASTRIEAPKLKAYAEKILERLLAHSPLPTPAIAVHVVADRKFGASATPENDIFVNLGAFNEATTTDQFAALLAHEAAHIILDHFDREELIQRQRKLTNQLGRTAQLASGFQHTKFGDRPDGKTGFYQTPQGKADSQKTATQALIAQEAINFVAKDVVGASWNRQQEDEADLLGMDMLILAGYDRGKALGWFNTLQAAIGEYESQLAKMNAENSELETAIQADPTLQGTQTAFVTFMSKVAATAWTDLRGWMRRSHLDPADRRKATGQYLGERWRGQGAPEGSEAPPDDIDNIRATGEFKRLWERYGLVDEAAVAFGEGDFATASSKLRQGMKGTVAKDAYPVELKAKLIAQQGDYKKAIRTLREIRSGDVRSVDGYRYDALWQLKLGDASGALLALDNGAIVYGEEPFYPTRISALAAADRGDEVFALGQKCATSNDDDLKAECAEALSRVPPEQGGQLGQEQDGNLFESLGLSPF